MNRFSELCKSHLSTIFAINSVFALFCLPWAVWTIVCQCFSVLLVGASEAVGGALSLWCMGNLPCFLLLAVGLGGVTKCCANLYYEDSGNVSDGFRQGGKNTGKYCLYAVLLWLSLSAAVLSTVWVGKINLPDLVAYALAAVAVVQFVFVLSWVFTCATQNLFYFDKWSDVATNGWKLVFTKLSFVGWALLTISPIVVTVLLPFVWQLVAWVITLVLLPVPLVLVVVVNYKKVFDAVTHIR